jgi:uncharacterized membrane protein YvbJ
MSSKSQCPTCGTDLSDSASFCPSCGQSRNHDESIDASAKNESVKTLRRVGVLSTAKVMTIVLGLVAVPFLFLGILFSLFSGNPMGAALTVAIAIGYVVFYSISVIIGTWLFNIALRWVGGIDIDLE